jgi:hypothetical protein
VKKNSSSANKSSNSVENDAFGGSIIPPVRRKKEKATPAPLILMSQFVIFIDLFKVRLKNKTLIQETRHKLI